MHWHNDSGKCTLHFTSYFTGKLDSFGLPYWKDFLKQGRLDRTIASQCQSSLWLFFQQVLQDLITKNPSNTASMIQTTWTIPWSTKEQSSTSPKASNLGELDSRMDWAIESQYQSSPWFFFPMGLFNNMGDSETSDTMIQAVENFTSYFTACKYVDGHWTRQLSSNDRFEPLKFIRCTSSKASNLGKLDSRMDWTIVPQYQSIQWFFPNGFV